MGIQRWSPPGSEIDLAENGEFVLFSDHEQVVARAYDDAHCKIESIYADEITRLRAELAAKSKDAERYRWLTDPDFGRISISDIFNAWWRSDNGHPETINDAIDIAMKQDEAAMGEGNG